MFCFICLVAILALVKADRRSPNAGIVEDFVQSPVTYSSSVIEDALLDAPGLIRKYGYPIEIHNVTTSDGYILEAHRIPHGRNDSPGKRQVVFLMHGLLSSSADFLILGPGNALAYLLADAGYDVWLGNARGNYYSRRHINLNPNDKEPNFWKFSWEQIGHYDLPAFIDRILEVTEQSRIHFIGHSQGGTAFFVLNSLRPEYNNKFASFHGFGPAAYFEHCENNLFNTLAPYISFIETAAFKYGLAELLPNGPILKWLGITFCSDQSPLQSLCIAALNRNGSFDTFNKTIIPLILGHAPAGASIRQVTHYGQTIRRNTFARFNFDPLTNLILYGRLTPPEFNLSSIKVPAYLYYGLSDVEVNWKDIHLLSERLGNTIDVVGMERETFNHYDFIWGSHVKEELYDRLIATMKSIDDK